MTQEIRDISLPPTRVAIVSLAKYPELFEGLDNNLKQYADNSSFDKVLVRDGYLIEEASGWKIIDGPEDFNFSGNVNLGWGACDENSDVFFISDDVRLKQSNTIEELRDLAYLDSSIGILAPRVIGPADNSLQTDPPKDRSLVYSERYLVFVCLYIKRSVIKRVGLMDKETFNGYGYDDCDYSRRVKKEGFKLAIAPFVEIVHGVKGKGTETFLKSEKGIWNRLKKQNEYNEQCYFKKWGDTKKENW
jgi:GT2 family glycosyltransferase